MFLSCFFSAVFSIQVSFMLLTFAFSTRWGSSSSYPSTPPLSLHPPLLLPLFISFTFHLVLRFPSDVQQAHFLTLELNRMGIIWEQIECLTECTHVLQWSAVTALTHFLLSDCLVRTCKADPLKSMSSCLRSQCAVRGNMREVTAIGVMCKSVVFNKYKAGCLYTDSKFILKHSNISCLCRQVGLRIQPCRHCRHRVLLHTQVSHSG